MWGLAFALCSLTLQMYYLQNEVGLGPQLLARVSIPGFQGQVVGEKLRSDAVLQDILIIAELEIHPKLLPHELLDVLQHAWLEGAKLVFPTALL